MWLCRSAFSLPFNHLTVVRKIYFPNKVPNNLYFLSAVAAGLVRRMDYDFLHKLIHYFQIVAPYAGHILDDNRFDLSRFRKPYHLIPTGSVESYAGYAVVNEKSRVREPVILCILQKDFFLESDLSRGDYPGVIHFSFLSF